MSISPQYIINRCESLQSNWTARRTKFQDWYDILLLTDELEQEGMESVATNDPRTAFNLALHLLVSMTIADNIPSDGLKPEEIAANAELKYYISRRWKDQESRYRTIGRKGWNRELFSWMLALGWYSVFTMVTDNEVWAEVWSPAECYPEFGPDGLVEHARIYILSAAVANRKIRNMGWSISRPFTSDTIFYDLWAFDADGAISNAIVAGNEFVKEPVIDINASKVSRLPIFTSPVGGLPDMGSVGTSNKNYQNTKRWQHHFGESILATNEDLNLNYNKMRTFLQQAARTAAQPHWLELSTGDTPIATETLMNRWGSILRGQPGDEVRPLQPPAIPLELSNMLFAYQNELQRGLFPYAVYGNIQQQMSYLAMANAASASMQVLTPYIEAFKGLRTDINNFWVDMITKNNLHPHKYTKPKNLPPRDQTMFDVEVSVEIPGYMIQRATIARMINPNFRLPETWVIEKMFPEIKDPLHSRADIRAEDAMRHPKAILVDQILAYLEQARVSRKANNTRAAELFEKLAASLEQELSGTPAQPQQPQRSLAEESILREAFPVREAEAPIEGLGRI